MTQIMRKEVQVMKEQVGVSLSEEEAREVEAEVETGEEDHIIRKI